jgi:hypothetical protein
MPAGSKTSDDQQEYQFSHPFVTPAGHEFSFYDTPGNERLVIRHTSGSHIEFKADGSIFIKAVKDIHTHSGVLSSDSNAEKGSDTNTLRTNNDYAMEIGGKLTIKCSELDLEISGTGRVISGTDLIVSANNLIQKSTESISLEGTKSIYVDTKEIRERVVSRVSEVGTMEDGKNGGVNVLNVSGNTVIKNDDVNGGISIMSAGYLNLVCGQERVDITGRYTENPSAEARATFTNKVYTPIKRNLLDVSTRPGDYYFSVGTDSTININLNSFNNVGLNEFTNVFGINVQRAAKLFLN